VASLAIFFCLAAIWDLVGPMITGWQPGGPVDLWTPRLFAILSAGLLILIRGGRVRATRLVELGLVYEVLICFAVSFVELIMSPDPGRPAWVVSLASIFIILFPMFVPTTLRRTLVTGLAAASTGPVAAVLYATMHGIQQPTVGLLLRAYIMNYLVVWLVLRTAKQIRFMDQELLRARQMGSYELKELLGRGGMGEVWQASHRMLRRPAAVKLIRPEALGASNTEGSDTVVRRFEREAQATAELHSQHTIRLYDFGATEEGTLFYVMELLNGLNLTTLVERFGPQPASRAAHLLLQACDSLWDAHQSQLIHRDIKPANIYTCCHGHVLDFVKVLDFGLVKFSDGQRDEQTAMTQAGVLTGTPAFMAPEMAQEGKADARSDLYALGCVGYWLLTGQLVFEHDTPLQMALAHIQEAPVFPSQRTEIDVPPQLEMVLLSCLEKDPAHRPQTARELALSIEACGCHKEWTADRAKEWWQTHMAP
jgi:serine/threonine-protein kinase